MLRDPPSIYFNLKDQLPSPKMINENSAALGLMDQIRIPTGFFSVDYYCVFYCLLHALQCTMWLKTYTARLLP